MAKDIAALNGGDKTAFKAALAGMGYMVPISSVAISSPVEYVDIALPSGYSNFRIVLSMVEAPGALAAGFSADGGITFLSDVDNADTYSWLEHRLTMFTGTGAVLGSQAEASYFYFGVDAFAEGAITIWPASGNVLVEAISTEDNGGHIIRGFARPNPLATIPPVGPYNAIRFMAQISDEDLNNPGPDSITAGTFHLFGIPTP